MGKPQQRFSFLPTGFLQQAVKKRSSLLSPLTAWQDTLAYLAQELKQSGQGLVVSVTLVGVSS